MIKNDYHLSIALTVRCGHAANLELISSREGVLEKSLMILDASLPLNEGMGEKSSKGRYNKPLLRFITSGRV